MLSAYYEKIGSRDMVGKKRKGRPSNVVVATSSSLLPNAKKQKVESQQATDKAKIVSDEGNESGAGVPKKDQAGMGAGNDKKTDPKSPSPKKRRGRPPKAKAFETAAEVITTSKTGTGTVRPRGASFGMGMDNLYSTGSNEISSLIEEADKMDKLRALKNKPTSLGFTSTNKPGERIASHSGDDIPKKRPDRPAKIQDQLSLTADIDTSGKDIEKKMVGRLSKNAAQSSSQKKLDPFAEGIAKKGLGGRVKTKESAGGQLNQGLAGSMVKKGARSSPKSGGSAVYEASMTALRAIPAKSGPGRPAKGNSTHGFEKEREADDDEDHESSALG